MTDELGERRREREELAAARKRIFELEITVIEHQLAALPTPPLREAIAIIARTMHKGLRR